ncbi:MAG TPA: MFS transporter [Jiangellaceae bacterium]
MIRDTRTLALYAALGCLGYVLTGLGAILPELRIQYDLPRTEAALYPSGFAAGLIVVGVVGDRIARRFGRGALPAAAVALAVGTGMLALGGDRFVAGAGAIVLGLGGAGLVLLVPATLRVLHGDNAPVPIGEANATASAASVLAPLLIGAAIGTRAGWQAAFFAVPLAGTVVVVAVLLWAGGHTPLVARDQAANAEPSGRAPREFWWWWITIIFSVGVEFCILFWAADFLRTQKALAAGAATAALVGFVLGMAIGRATTGPVLRLFAADTGRLLAAELLLAAAGFALFWAAPIPAVAFGGLMLSGLGVALLYPVALAEALAAWPAEPARAASRCALASGLAIGAAPLLLGTLADQIGLRTAVLLTPTLIILLLTRVIRRAWDGRRATAATVPAGRSGR